MEDFDGGLKLALKKLGSSNSDQIAESVWDLFSSISIMSPEQVIASFQTLVALADQYKMLESPFVIRLLDAMRIRMAVLHHSKENHSYYDAFVSTLDSYKTVKSLFDSLIESS